MNGPPDGTSSRLDSWKEIAAYLRRDVRTAQRWEEKEGLPVQREEHGSRASVYAEREELDAWLANRRVLSSIEIVSSPRPVRRIWAIVGFALLLAVALATSGSRDVGRVTAFHERDWVLVDAFENRTGDPLLEGALKNALGRELSNSNFLYVAPRERVEDALRLMRKPPETKMDASLAREVCLRDGIRAFVTGRTEKLGSTYLFSVEVIDPIRDLPVAVHTEPAAGQDQIWPAVRRLSNWVRESLGEAMDRIERSNRQLEKVTTPSLRALQLFTEADEASKHAQWPVSAQLTREAVANDPNFASAHIYLAYALKNTRDSGWEAEAQRAMVLSDTVSERERLFIVASYYILNGKQNQAVPVLEALVRIYPDHYFGYRNLANIYVMTGRIQQARVLIPRAADLRPNDYFINALATQLLLPVDLDRGSHYAQRARMLMQLQSSASLSPLDQSVLFSHFDELWLGGDGKGASTELDRLARLPQMQMASPNLEARRVLALRYVILGRFRAAKKWIEDPATAWIFALASGDEGEVRKDLIEIWANDHPRVSIAIALIALHLGMTGWDKFSASIDGLRPEQRDGINGVSALQEGRTAQAISLLRQSFDEAGEYGADAAEGLSLALEQSGSLQQAAEALEPISNERVNGRNTYPYGAANWLRTRAHLAQLYRKIGRTGDARKIEDQLRRLLAVADPEHPILQQLRKR